MTYPFGFIIGWSTGEFAADWRCLLFTGGQKHPRKGCGCWRQMVWIQTLPSHRLVVRLQETHVTSLCLSFPTCNVSSTYISQGLGKD